MPDRGLKRERRLMNLLREDGWIVVRAAKGPVDLVLVRHRIFRTRVPMAVSNVRLVQVKSSAAGAYAHFGPKDRQELLELAKRAGAEAWLIWWPPRQDFQWIPSSEWPQGPRRQVE